MTYQTLLLTKMPQGINITINRLEHRNAINSLLLKELHQVLDEAEADEACKIMTLKGQQGFFCSGMDFQEMIHIMNDQAELVQWTSHYMLLLKRFALSSKIIISLIDGQVIAGGVGLVAASDLVLATSKSQFCLSEALWGLLPANVLPYLIRRIGFQKAYFLTLSTQKMMAIDAQAIHLIDELSDDLEDTFNKYVNRLSRLEVQTVKNLKNYFRKLWMINEDTEQHALSELVRLIQQPQVQTNIKRFIEQGKFPWET